MADEDGRLSQVDPLGCETLEHPACLPPDHWVMPGQPLSVGQAAQKRRLAAVISDRPAVRCLGDPVFAFKPELKSHEGPAWVIAHTPID